MNVHQLHCSYVLLLAVLLLPRSSSQSSSSAAEVNNSVTPSSFNPPAPNGTRVILRRLWSTYTTTTVAATGWTEGQRPAWTGQISHNSPGPMMINDFSKVRPNHSPRQTEDEEDDDDDEEEEEEEVEDEDDDEEEEDEVDDDEDNEPNKGSSRRQRQRQHNDVESWIQSHKLYSSSSVANTVETHPTPPPAPGGPIISSIRHHKSRKTFTRTRKVKHSDKKGTGSSATTPSQILFHEQGDQPMLDSKSIHSSSSSSSTSVGGIRKLFSPLPPGETREEPGGFMPVNNDTGMVYGKPYFSSASSSSKKHNATSLNRIKTFLLRNSSSVSSSQQRNGKQEEVDVNRDISNGQLSEEKIARVPVAVDHEKGFKSVNNSPASSHLPLPVNRKTTGKTYEESYQEEQGGGEGSTSKATTTSSRVQSSRVRTNRRLKSKQEQQPSNNNSTDSTVGTATAKRNRNKGIKGSNKQEDNQNLNSQEENGKLQSSAGSRGGSRRNLERQEEKKRKKQQSRLLAPGLASSGESAGEEQNPSTQIVQGLLESTTSDYGLNVNRSADWWWDDKRRNDEERVNVPGIGGNEQRDHEEDLSPSYFPGSERAAGEEDGDVKGNSNKTAGKSLFNDYGLLGSDEESRDVLQASSPTDETSASAPLSSSPSSSAAATSIGLSTASKTKPDIDIVTKFLRIVETQHTLGDNCTAGTAFSLGEGVVDRYAQERFRLEAEIAVNRANMLTRLWKYAPAGVLDSEYLLHASLFSMVEFDDDIFAAGNCYDKLQYKNYTLFCPFAYRLPEGNILVKDLAVEYKYLSNTSEWFYIARKNAERVIKNHNQFSRGFHSYTYNESTHTDRVQDEILNVTYDDGKWSKPYFDCGGGNIWMMTYTVPFFGFKDDYYFFKGTSGIDIDLRRVDIDQCPLPENSTELNIFAASDKCKNATTKCIPIKGLGFRRGSYRCECQPGYYFPNTSSTVKYFNGTVLEEEYEKKLLNEETMYDEEGAFECLKCLEGCDTCVDDRPCVVTLNWLMRTAILILQCAIIAMLPIVGLFTWKYSDIKVVRAASPVLLRFIVLGAFLIYCTILVLYPSPSVITCTIRVWLREIGFSLAYGALMLKTWRISVIFRVRSAKAVKITDLDLMKRLGVIVAIFTALLVIRTLVAPPVAIISLTADDLKAWLCKTDWWDHSFTIMELLFLVWGIRLCIVVRKAPSEFNESKFISLAIYNEFLLSVFLNISMLFLQSPANPDLLYIIFFCHVQLTMTLLLCLIFGSKAYMVFRGHGKGNALDETRVPTFISKNRSGQKPKQPSVQNSTTGLHSSTTSTSHDPNFNSRLSEDVQEEFRRLYYQLEELKERNMRFGNRHLVAKIRAMQEAADSILGTTGSGMTQANCHLQPGLEMRGRDGGGGATSYGPDGGGAGSSSNNDKGSSSNVLSDITEEEGGNSGGASDKGGKDGGKKGKRLSFLGRVKSPKGLVSSRCKAAASSPSSSKNNSSGSETSGSASPMKKKGELAGSKSAQQAGGSGVSKRTSDECGAETSAKPEEDDDDDSVLLAHGGVYIGEVKSDRPPAKGTPVRGNTQPKPPPSSSEPLPSTSSQSNGCSQQQQSLLTSVQVHPLAGEEASVKEDEHVRRSALKDDDELSTAAVTCNKGVGMMNTCDYFQSRNDQGNCSRDCEQEEGEEYIPLNLIRPSSSVTTTTEGERTSVTAVVVRSASSNSSSATTATEAHPAKSSSVSDNVASSSSEAPTSSSDKNHSAGENQNNKILLDLNDKSRFTEEITV